MAMGAPRHQICCLVILWLTVAAPAGGQSDDWAEVSRAGVLAAEEGRFAEAERLFRDALQLSGQLPEGSARRATSLNNLAFTLHAQGLYIAAEGHYREALAMREAALGKDHADVAQSCNNLAELYRILGRYAEAEALHQRAREIRERQFGSEHPEMAQTLNNLGVLYASRGRYEEAEPLYQQALEIRIASYGDDHLTVAETRNNLGTLYY